MIVLVSDQNKFLFIHIQKTAGTSITNHLQKNIPDLKSYLEPHSPNSLADAKYSEYYKVAFVRNPFDRLVSWYTMITQKCIHLSEEEKSKHPNLIWRQVLLYSNSFETFIERSEDIQSRSGWKPFYNNQVDYLMDKEGSITVDYIGKFESLQKDFSTVAGKLGLHNSTLPHKNQSKHRSYRDYYNEKTREIVMQRYRRDLEFFGYTF